MRVSFRNKRPIKAFLLLLTIQLLWLPFAFAQTLQTVQGVVYNSEGAPEAKVNVAVKNSKIGVSTDDQGRFILSNVPPKGILVISAVGFTTQELPIQGRTNFTINLQQSSQDMDQVVVVGYGTQRKVTKTGSISDIKGEEIRRTPSASIQNTLSGRLPGFFSVQRSGRPGADGADFFIRGVSTFAENSQQPYILVDDIEFSYSQFSRIDPNEVESITVLKDAATTAIYGIKGANGVILVTTRRGKNGKPKIGFRSQTGFQVPVKPMKFLNSYDAAVLTNQALANDGLAPRFSQDDLNKFKDGSSPYTHPDVNWYDEIIKKYTLMSTNNLDISGGAGRVKYFVSLGYLWQNGITKSFTPPAQYKDDNINKDYYYKRYNFRSNLDITATNTLNFKLDVSGNAEERNQPSVAGAGIFYDLAHYEELPPFAYPMYNPDGSYGFNGNPNVAVSPEFKSNNVIGRLALGGYNRDFGNQLNINLSGVQKLDVLTKGLSFRVTTAYTSINMSNRTLSRGNAFPSFAYNPNTNVYTPRTVDGAINFRVAPLSLSYSAGSPVKRITSQAALNYTRSFGDHNVGGLLLYNRSSESFSTGDRNTNYIPSNLIGFTYRATYNYKQKYMFELNGANNGTNRFVTQKRYGFFPAVSVGYNIAEENFFKKSLSFIDLFKLRGSWGIVGDDGVSAGSRYLYEEVYNRTAGIAFFGESPNSMAGISEGFLGNNDVTWQKERKMNVGADFSFFDKHFSGSVDVFDNYRFDILRARQTVPLLFGINTSNIPPVNLGKVSNKGFEIELNYRGRIRQMEINIRGTYSYAKNKILEIDEPPAKYPWMQQTGTSIGTSRMFIWDGFYQDSADIANSAKPSGVIKPGYLKYRDLNGDKLIDDFDKAYMGNPNIPNTNIGLNLGFNYKGFSLNALFQAATGYNFHVGWRLVNPFKANLQPLHQQYWTPGKGNDAAFPLITTTFNGTYMSPSTNATNLSTFWSMKAHYIRFRSLEIGYSLPKKWIDKLGMEDFRLVASGFNLYTWSNVFKKYFYDPETIANVGDVNYGTYPQQRIYNLGVNIMLK